MIHNTESLLSMVEKKRKKKKNVYDSIEICLSVAYTTVTAVSIHELRGSWSNLIQKTESLLSMTA